MERKRTYVRLKGFQEKKGKRHKPVPRQPTVLNFSAIRTSSQLEEQSREM